MIKNSAENLVYQTEKVLKENGDKISAAKKQPVEKAVLDLKEALKSGDTELDEHNYVQYMQQLNSAELSPSPHEQRSLVERHYELITEFVPRDYQISIAFMPFNVHKNRSLIVPGKMSHSVTYKQFSIIVLLFNDLSIF